MKFFDFRKYFFSYIYIILGLSFICFLVLSLKFEPAYLPNNEPNTFQGYRGDTYTILMIVSLYLYLYSSGLLIIEILFQKFIFKKIFPNFKSPLKIPMKPKLIAISSNIFYILLGLASIPIIAFTVYSIYFTVTLQF